MAIVKRMPIFFSLILMVGCREPIGGPVPIIEPPTVELPQYGLDFSVTTDKKVYLVGEPVTIGIKVKNSDKKPHTIRIAPEDHDTSVYPPRTATYSIEGFAFYFQELFLDAFTVTIPPDSEMQIEALNWTWRQVDEILKEQVDIGIYGVAGKIGRLDVDGKRIGEGYFFIDHIVPLATFSIVHPTVDILEKRHDIFFRGGAALPYVDPGKPYRMLAGIENRGNKPKKVSLKPVSNYPIVRIRVFGPIKMKPYPPPRPRQVALREIREPVTVTINPNRIYTVLDWEWEQRDWETGELVPPGKDYLMVVEFCGMVEVDGQHVGVIETPLKVFRLKFSIGKPPEQVHIDPYPGSTAGDKPPPSDPSSSPPEPPNW
jgi:hypothetical protein